MASLECIVWYLCNGNGATKMVLGDVIFFAFAKYATSSQIVSFPSYNTESVKIVIYII